VGPGCSRISANLSHLSISDLDLDLDLDAVLDLAILAGMNFRKLEVYQTVIRFLPLAAGMADSLPPR
jgi:hypothetical protein